MVRSKNSMPVRKLQAVYTIDDNTDPGLSALLAGDLKTLNEHIQPILREINDNVNDYGITIMPTPKGLGKFASKPICETNVLLGIYTGRLHFANTPVPDNGRHMNLRSIKGVDLFIEGSDPSPINAADFNHSCCKANTTFRYVATLPAIVVTNTRPIEAGEELLLDYGDSYFRSGGSMPCLCEEVCPKGRFF